MTVPCMDCLEIRRLFSTFDIDIPVNIVYMYTN